MSPTPDPLRSERGQTLPIVAVFMVVIIALAGLVIDIGNVERVRASMQNAADAAATSGASTLLDSLPSNGIIAEDTAREYGMDSTGKNQVDGIDTDSVSQHIDVHCDVQYSGCSPSTGPNTVTVHESASVPTFFMGMFGFGSIRVGVDSEACAPCSETQHDIMLVLDRTGSMAYGGKATNNLAKIDNLKNALLQGFLTTLDPDVDRVGLVVFPPDTASSGTCATKDGGVDYYHATDRNYLALGLQGGFADRYGSPDQSSSLVRDIQCLSPIGPTDYADPLAAAQAQLAGWGRAGVDKVIVMISDGGANELDASWNCTTYGKLRPSCQDPCRRGIEAAQAAKDAGTDVYAIAYGDLGPDEMCRVVDDYVYADRSAPQMSGYDAMEQIASPGKYYPDPDPAELKYLLRQVTGAIVGGTGSRLTK